MTDSEEPEISSAPVPTGGKRPAVRSLYAVIIVLVLIIAGLAVLNFTHVTAQGSSSTVSAASTSAVTGNAYNLTIHTNGQFKSLTVYFGDNSHTTVYYSGTTNISISHVYENSGNYYIYYVVNFGSTQYVSSGSLIKVTATSSSLNQFSSLGLITLIPSQSSHPEVNQTTIFTPGSHASFLVGFYTSPANTSYQVIGETLSIYHNGTLLENIPLQYVFNSSSGQYLLPASSSTLNMTDLQSGYYEVGVQTFTGMLSNTTTGAINSSAGIYSTTDYLDIPVFNNAALYQAQGSNSVFVNDQVAPGGYTTLDPAINYDLLGYSILDNTDQWLLTFNKSSATSFLPALASAVPSVQNGGINNNYANYTKTTPWGTSYTVHIKPFENYTFHIRQNASFQDNTAVTSWDVMYSLTRTLLFDGGSPGTPGWIQAQYLLPGDFYSSNTFYNITQNITVDNSTNNITFHFQSPMPSALAFEVLETSGTWITSANWLEAHGAGITWTPAGFQSYVSQGNSNNYNAYVENHVLASGPYKIEYIIPSSQVVLVANPAFVSPGPWYPAPKINKIVINYISKASTAYLGVKSGEAQGTSIPTSDWKDVNSLTSSGIAKSYGYASLGISWYSFNAFVDTSALAKIDTSANMPPNLFTDLNVRYAFAYAFDYNNYLNYDVGNAIYHTQFGSRFAGALPAGMLYAQSLQQLNATGAAVPYYNPTLAKKDWNNFMNSPAHSTLGITMNGKYAMYGGSKLVVPIFLQTGDPVDVAGATTWQQNVFNATGITMSIVSIPFPILSSYEIPGANPMPIFYNDWFPDYPYPTDYLSPIALPSNNSVFVGAADFTPYWIYGNTSDSYQNQTEALALQSMVNDYNNGTSAVVASQAKLWFQTMNSEFVNMSLIVPLQQMYQWREISSKINPTDITTYESNIMVAGSDIMLYNYLSYT